MGIGATAVAGSILVAAGALMPWLSLYAGLKVYTGTAGLYGRLLLAGGIAGALCGVAYTLRPDVRLRWAIGLLGGLLFGFCCWIVVQLFAVYREVGGNPFVVGRLGVGLFVSAFGGAVILATMLLPADHGEQSFDRTARMDGIVAAVAAASGGAAIIHFAVLGEHIREYWAFGAFFATAGVCQMLWALLVVRWPGPPLLLAGALGNTLIVALWLISRTGGVPIGPDAGSPEAIGFPDLLATAYELVVVAGCVGLLTGGFRLPLRLGRAQQVAGWLLVLVTLPLTIAAMLAAVHATTVVGHL
jgi:hypothetical protein